MEGSIKVMVDDLETRIATAKKKAAERETTQKNLRKEIIGWPEFSQFDDIHIYVGARGNCGYLAIFDRNLDLENWFSKSEKDDFERKVTDLISSYLKVESKDLFSFFEYDSMENIDTNYGGSISRRLSK